MILHRPIRRNDDYCETRRLQRRGHPRTMILLGPPSVVIAAAITAAAAIELIWKIISNGSNPVN